MLEGYRHPGEFERQSDVFMEWIPDSYMMLDYDNGKSCAEVVKALQDYGDATLHINCGEEGVYERAKECLTAYGVDVSKIDFLHLRDPNCYVRDNGPTVMVDDKGGRVLINPNWSFYGTMSAEDPYCKQSRIAAVQMGVSLGIFDIVNSDLVSEGGDREFNGQGVMMCIEDTEVRKRNPGYTKEQVEAEYKRLYNVEKIIWLPQPMLEDDDYRMAPLEYRDGIPYIGSSYAAHTDEMCRFIDAHTVLLAEVTDEEAASSPVDAENRRRLDAAYEVLKTATDVDGNPFTIKRMPVTIAIDYVLTEDDSNYALYKGPIDEMGGNFADGTPWPEGPLHLIASTGYCNFLICNGVVVGQRYWNEGMDPAIKAKDEAAKAVLEECFPDRKVIMADTLALNMTGGGVHCWTKNVPASGPLAQ